MAPIFVYLSGDFATYLSFNRSVAYQKGVIAADILGSMLRSWSLYIAFVFVNDNAFRLPA